MDTATHGSSEGRIPAGIVCAGPDAASHTSVVEQTSLQQHEKKGRVLVSLSSSSGSNLKAYLKTIIQRATSHSEGTEDDEDGQVISRKGSKLLNYDLQMLHDYVRDRGLEQVAIVIQDTEAWDSDLLSELIKTLGSWHDRIPFVLLLNIATSLDFLQQRLSKQAIRCLKGQMFDLAPSTEETEKVFDAVTDLKVPLWIGAGLMNTILERQNDYVQSIDSFTGAVKYAYMSCYYANALSIFMDPAVNYENVPGDHYEAIRSLGSFRNFCQQQLADDQVAYLKDLLDNDKALFDLVQQEVKNGRDAMADITVAITAIREVQRCLHVQPLTAKSKLYIQALSGQLVDSSSIRSLLLSIRKAPSNTASEIMSSMMKIDFPQDILLQCAEIYKQLNDVLNSQKSADQPLRSEDDVKNSTLRTTVVAQKVELSKQKSSLSKQDAEYTAILRRFTDLLESYFKDKLINPKSLVFHEIFLYDLKSPHREVFTPRPRHAIERALAAPHDYLDCECCATSRGDTDEATLSASQPATAVLYQLYLETGSLINVSDLWQAFQAVMGEKQSDEQNMALFMRALADLRNLGLVKGTRKRVDHVAKVAWRGL